MKSFEASRDPSREGDGGTGGIETVSRTCIRICAHARVICRGDIDRSSISPYGDKGNAGVADVRVVEAPTPTFCVVGAPNTFLAFPSGEGGPRSGG